MILRVYSRYHCSYLLGSERDPACEPEPCPPEVCGSTRTRFKSRAAPPAVAVLMLAAPMLTGLFVVTVAVVPAVTI